jgi:elongation factor 2
VYRESVTKTGAPAKAASPNKQNRFTVQVEPEEEAKQLQVAESGSVLSFDEHRNVLIDKVGLSEQLGPDVLSSIIGGFEYACSGGPLCAEPMRRIKVSLLGLEVSEEEQARGSSEVMRGVCKAIFGSFLTAKPVLLEPVFKIVITAPTELAGDCSRIMETKRGKISSFEQKGLLTIITGRIPVAETFGLSKELRSATSGRAFWQSMLDCWQEVPKRLAEKVIAEVRQRKGLAQQVPDASRFAEES